MINPLEVQLESHGDVSSSPVLSMMSTHVQGGWA